MGPKKGKKKKGKKKKKEHVPPIPPEFYIDQIVELNNILAKMRTKSFDQVHEYDQLNEKKDQVLHNRHDIYLYNTRTMESNLVKEKLYDQKIRTLNHTFQADREQAEVDIKTAETKWNKWNDILDSDVRILDGRILQFEKDKNNLYAILFNQQIYQKIAKSQDMNYLLEKYDKEREIVILKYELATEVEKRLYILALNYENTIDMRVSTYSKQLIRENISLNWEMDRLITTNRRLQNELNDFELLNRNRLVDLNISRVENKRLLRTAEKQNHLIMLLSGELEQRTSTHCELEFLRKTYYNFFRKYLGNAHEFRVANMKHIMAILEKYYQLANIDIDRLQKKRDFYRDEINKLMEYFMKLIEKINSSNSDVNLTSQ